MSSSSAAPIDDITRLGRYRLLEPIGGGATSVVYAAHDDRMERRVAVKMIAAELRDDPEARECFYREARVTTHLVHRNIVAVLDMGEDEGCLSFTGPDLRSTLQALLSDDQPWAPVEAPDRLSQILLKALSKDPADRYQSCSDMFMHLQRVTL